MATEEFIYELQSALSFPNEKPYDKKLWGYWSDGIYPTCEGDELRKLINDKRFIELTMEYGLSGQEPYTLVIYFGNKSLSRNARGLDLIECIPDFSEEPNSISINPDNKIVEIYMK